LFAASDGKARKDQGEWDKKIVKDEHRAIAISRSSRTDKEKTQKLPFNGFSGKPRR
jgi:hypothetical protein